MRFSTSGQDDLANQERQLFSNASGINIPVDASGKIYIYAQYGYDTGTFGTAMDDVNRAKFSE